MNSSFIEQEQSYGIWDKQTVSFNAWKTPAEPLESAVICTSSIAIICDANVFDTSADEFLDHIDTVFDDSRMTESEFAAYQRALDRPASAIQPRAVPEV